MVIKRKFDTDEEAFVKNAKYNAFHNVVNKGTSGGILGLGIGTGAGAVAGGVIGKRLSKKHGVLGAIAGAGLGTLVGGGTGTLVGGGIGLLRGGKNHKVAIDKEGKLKDIFRNLSEDEKKKIMTSIRNDNDLFEHFGYGLNNKGRVYINDKTSNKRGLISILGKEQPIDPKKLHKHF